jgi:hypothetical protein
MGDTGIWMGVFPISLGAFAVRMAVVATRI